jgi:O-antigen/teichoic acid export membrane protein
MLRDSWPLILSGFVFIFYSRIDQVMIKHMLGNEEVGVYSVAVRFSDLWAFLPGTIGAALYPSILNARKSGTALYLKKMQQLFDVMLWVCIGVIIPATYLLGDWAISSWYGPEYADAADVLKIYVISGIFAYTGTALYYWLLTENKQRYGLIRAIIGAVINVLLNWLFIPVWGIKGAAFATLISEFFGSYISSLLTKSTFPAFKMQTKTIFLYSTFLQVAELGRRLGRRRLRWISLVLK